MIELGVVLQLVRSELSRALAAGEGENLQLVPETMELEVTVGVQKSSNGRMQLMVSEIGDDTSFQSASMQRIKLTLQPREGSRGGQSPYWSGVEVAAER